MKKSDLVIIISDLIYDWYSEGANVPLANTIVDEIEKLGMKPPVRKDLLGVLSYADSCQWEKEDD